MTGYGHSWHQAHDQATVLLLVPYDTLPEEVSVHIEQHYLIAGVKDQAPLIKGRLYGSVQPESSTWQLEPRTTAAGNLSLEQQIARERTRTTSTTSTVSNASSYAVVSSDPDISSSFAASLASGRQSIADDYNFMSAYPHGGLGHRRHPTGGTNPASIHSSPNSHPQTPLHPASIPASPRITESSWAGASAPASVSASSLQSSRSSSQVHLSRAGRLLTIYLEKSDSIIWPSVIVGPIPSAVYPHAASPPGVMDGKEEERYNMDPISLGVMGVEHAEAGRREEAFEYFVRAWHQTHTPLSTLRLVPYLPPTATVDLVLDSDTIPGSGAHYLVRLGGVPGLAKLYLDAGLLYLEGVADTYLPRPISASSIGEGEADGEGEDDVDVDNASSLTTKAEAAAAKIAAAKHSLSRSQSSSGSPTMQGVPESEKWKQEKAIARKLFDRARMLDPRLDIPILPPDVESGELKMPSVTIDTHFALALDPEKPRRRRRNAGKPGESMVEQADSLSTNGEEDGGWYMWLPGLIGAGTALVAVGLIGAMSIGSWRKSQNS